MNEDNRRTRTSLVVACTILLSAARVESAGEDSLQGWRQWGGPNRNFAVAAEDLSQSWLTATPREVFRRPLEEGQTMRKQQRAFSILSVLITTPLFAGDGNWVEFTDKTGERLIASSDRGINDLSQKDMAWGDVDRDDDLDVVIVRKVDHTSPCEGSDLCQNQLLMNEGVAEGHEIDGVLVDRTLEYATAADDGGQGFFDITADRDVVLTDVNGDDWLDVVTAVSVSDGLPKTISHPRVYINQGEQGGNWLGFAYEEPRIPQFFTIGSRQPVAPRFTSVSAGDVTGDGAVDLYFTDHDDVPGAPPSPGDLDLNDRLLINDGNGNFVDSLESRMTADMLRSSLEGNAFIADMNGDSFPDVVKSRTGVTPQQISISYNAPNNPGFFEQFDVVYSTAPTHVTVGDLNGDGLRDLVVSDDGTDQYLINTGNGGDGLANFDAFTFSGDDGFAGNSVVTDLNKDGFGDVMIANVIEVFPVCAHRMHLYRNFGDLPNVTLAEDGGEQPWTPNGTHDLVVFDINGDSWPDMLVGTCSGYQVWIQDLPTTAIPAVAVGPRYVSLDVSDGQGAFAILVEGEADDEAVVCVSGYVQNDGTIGVDAIFQDAAGWGGTVFLTDEVMIPDATYSVRYDTGEVGSPELGPTSETTTFKWGDIDDNSVANFVDILLIVQAFQGNFGNVSLQAADLAPCRPNGIANFEDILWGVQAFQGSSYADTGCQLPCL
jgi:hypothetical protein